MTLQSMGLCRAGALAGALAVSLLASCTSITTAPSDSRLSGHWILDPTASDDAAARIRQAVTDAVKKMRARRTAAAGAAGEGAGGGPGGGSGGGRGGGGGGRRGSGTPGSGPDQGAGPGQTPEPAPTTAPPADGSDEAPESIIDQYGNTRLLGPDLRSLTANLVRAVASAHELELQVDGDSVRVRPDGLPPRDYRLGEGFSRFDEYGTARMQPRWSGGAFVLRARYTNGSSITERYEVLRGQSTLTRTVDLVDPVIGKLQLHSQYRPAPP